MTTRRLLVLPFVLALGVAACGSDDSGDVLPEPVGEAPDDTTTPTEPGDDTTVPTEPDSPDDVTSSPDPEPEPEPQPAPSDPPPGDDLAVIGRSNIGGTVVDPQPHPIDEIGVAESFPERLMVNFTAGDPNCTAADATATAVGDEVRVELFVGITEDALTRSCLAGDVEQTIGIALDEGLNGRSVVAVQPDDAGAPPADTAGDGSPEAMAEAILGLDVDTAEKQVIDAGFAFRPIEINGQPQAITQDLRGDRINVTIEDGIVIAAEVF